MEKKKMFVSKCQLFKKHRLRSWEQNKIFSSKCAISSILVERSLLCHRVTCVYVKTCSAKEVLAFSEVEAECVALAIHMNFVFNIHKCLQDQSLTFPCINIYSFTEFTIGVKWIVFITRQVDVFCNTNE